MEKSPFDGCVFIVKLKRHGAGTINLTSEGWGHHTFSAEELAPARADLKAIELRRFTHNFLRFNVTPGDVDWFGDFSSVSNNALVAARLARDGKAKGILFDVEPYAAPLFDFHKQPPGEGKAWTNYTAQVRRRGGELMKAFQEGFPGLTVFLTFGYTIAWEQMLDGKKPLEDCQYALLPALLDGMLAAAAGGSRLVEGCESAYGYKQPARFERQLSLMKTELLPIVADPGKYHATTSFGFGLWLDFDSHKRGWDTNDFSKNYFTPDVFETSVRTALRLADEYAWIYTQEPRWWTPEGTTAKLPPAYDAALRNAKQ